MSYTVEEIVDAVWAYSTRELDGFSPQPSDGSILDDIAYEVWVYNTRTADFPSTSDNILIGDYDFSSIVLDTFSIGQVHNVAILDYQIGPIELDALQLGGTDEVSIADFAFVSLSYDGISFEQKYLFSIPDFEFQPLIIEDVKVVREDDMAYTQASSGNVHRLTAATDTISGKCSIKMIRWVGATTAAHALELRTGAYGANDVIYHDVATAANYVRETSFGDKPLRVENIRVQTLGSGTVYIYLE